MLLQHFLHFVEELLKVHVRHRKRVLHALARALDDLAKTREINVEQFFENRDFGRALDHRGAQRRPEQIALGQTGHVAGAYRVERFGQRNPDAVLAQQVGEFDKLFLHR